ncbi:hypothetical protein GCM10028895_33190 [Pontibacter rugosus]
MLEHMEHDFVGWSNMFAPLIMGNSDRPSLGVELTNSFCSTDHEIAKHFAKVTFLSDNRKDLPKLQIQSLIMQCSEDIIVPREVGEYMLSHMKSAQMVYLNATGHCPNLSSPLETMTAIESFLA